MKKSAETPLSNTDNHVDTGGAPLPIPTAMSAVSPRADDRTIILLDANRVEIARTHVQPVDARDFRVTWMGRVYEHVGEDAQGRWMYAIQ